MSGPEKHAKTVNNNMQITNPFFIEMENKDLSGLEIRGIYSLYKTIYIICLKDFFKNKKSEPVPISLMKNNLTEKEINLFPKYYTVLDCPIQVLDNPKHRKFFKNVNSDFIKKLCPTFDTKN